VHTSGDKVLVDEVLLVVDDVLVVLEVDDVLLVLEVDDVLLVLEVGKVLLVLDVDDVLLVLEVDDVLDVLEVEDVLDVLEAGAVVIDVLNVIGPSTSSKPRDAHVQPGHFSFDRMRHVPMTCIPASA
jgi:hypothetical protein